MDGTFAQDIQHWVNFWTKHPGRPGSRLERALLVWRHHSLRATGLCRLANWCKRRHIPVLPTIIHHWNITLHGLDIVPGVPIGGGLYIPHAVGTVVMARSIGNNVTLVSNVTIGMRHTAEFPTIGDNVFIGAGARILGRITIGDGAVIGANAVVLHDVPPGATAVGVPARIIPAKVAASSEVRETELAAKA